MNNNFLAGFLMRLEVFKGYLLTAFVTLTHLGEVLALLCCCIIVDQLHFEARLETYRSDLSLNL